jgi:ubiquitin-protein ligase
MKHNNKRVNNELKKIINNNLEYNFTFYIDEKDKNILIIFLLYKNKLYKIDLIIPYEYPFKAPKVFIKKKNYINLLVNLSKIMYKDNKTCLCCSSLICSNNWNPQKNIINIINEIKINLDIYISYLNKNKNLLFSKKILNNFLSKGNEDIYKYISYYF